MMRRLLLGAFAALAVLAGSPDSADAWTQVSSYAPSGGPVAQGSAGSNFNGSTWIDEGGYWFVNSSNQALSNQPSSGNAWDKALLMRPSGEAKTTGRDIYCFTEQAGTGMATLYAASLYSVTSGVGTGYVVGVDGTGAFHFFSVLSSNLTNIGTPNSGYGNLTAGTSYCLVLDTVQGSGTTALTATLQSSTGTTLGTAQTVNDSTTALQGISGVSAIFEPTNSSYLTIDPLLTKAYTCTGTSSDGGAGCGVASYATATTISPTSASVYASATQTFSVNLNGPVASGDTVTVTLAVTCGSLSSTSLSFTTNAVQNVTFTAPGSATTCTLSGTHSVSGTTTMTMTDFANVAITVTASSQIAVNGAACHTSPGNWHGDTGRGGSVYREAWTSGAYVHCNWTTGASGETAILQFATNSNAAPIAVFLNGVLTDNVSTNGNYTLTGLTASTVEDLVFYTKLPNSGSATRWGNGTGAVVHWNGLLLDSGSTPGTATVPASWLVYNGDSLDEGAFANNGANDFLRTSGFAIEQQLIARGYDVSMQASSGTGFLIGTDTPPLYYVSGGTAAGACSGSAYTACSRWSLQDSGVSLLDSASQLSAYGSTGTTPAAYLLRYGTNDCNNGSIVLTDLTASVTGLITSLRAAAPSMKIIFMPGFPVVAGVTSRSGCLAALNSGFTNYTSANPSDTAVSEVQIPSSFASLLYGQASGSGAMYLYNSIHTNEEGNAISTPWIMGAIDAALAPAGGTTTVYVPVGRNRLPL